MRHRRCAPETAQACPAREGPPRAQGNSWGTWLPRVGERRFQSERESAGLGATNTAERPPAQHWATPPTPLRWPSALEQDVVTVAENSGAVGGDGSTAGQSQASSAVTHLRAPSPAPPESATARAGLADTPGTFRRGGCGRTRSFGHALRRLGEGLAARLGQPQQPLQVARGGLFPVERPEIRERCALPALAG